MASKKRKDPDFESKRDADAKLPKLSRSSSESNTECTVVSSADATSSSHTEIPCSDSENESRSVVKRIAFSWTVIGFDDLKVQVVPKIFEPHRVFDSFQDFFEKNEKKKDRIYSWLYNIVSDKERLAKYSEMRRVFEEIVDLDCESLDDHYLEGYLLGLNQKIIRDQGTSFGLYVKKALTEFVAQLIYMLSELKTEDSASLQEGMYQELFVRFARVFDLEIVSAPSIRTCTVKVGTTVVMSTPDCLVLVRGRMKQNVLAVVKVEKQHSTEDDLGMNRMLRRSEKEVIIQQVGEMLSKLKDSAIGPTGIYGFVLQGTEVTVVALSAEENYLEHLENGTFPETNYKGVTVKYSEKCNILKKKGRMALIQTFCDMADIPRFL